MRLTPDQARAICNVFCIPFNRDFHTLNSQHVQNILDAATANKYRKPRNANGSTARYYYSYLMHACNRSN